jgi:hypothetical protein
MSKFAERFIKQGELLGERKGIECVLLNQLRLKFGVIPQSALDRVKEADAETLLQWSRRMFDAVSPEEVVGG